MLLKYLLSIWCSLFLAGYANGQVSFCRDERATDSAIRYISTHFNPYVDDGWQQACDSLLAVCPDLDQVWQMKAMPNIKQGRWDQAYASLQRAVALKPSVWLPYQAFLKCIFSKDYEGAITDLKASERLVPGSGIMDHSFDFYTGLSYLCLDSLDKAYTYLQHDMAVQEKNRGKNNVHHVSLFYYGVCLMKMNKMAEAEQLFLRCLKIYPQYPEPNFYIGHVYALTGKKVLAKAYFVKAGQCYREGYNSGEDQEPYVNYPFAIATGDVKEAVQQLN